MFGDVYCPVSFHERGAFHRAKLLSEVDRHEKSKTKEPVTHPVNTRPLWVSSRPMGCDEQCQTGPIISPQQEEGHQTLSQFKCFSDCLVPNLDLPFGFLGRNYVVFFFYLFTEELISVNMFFSTRHF